MKRSLNSFEQMDYLSQNGEEFFFFIDFLSENIVILDKEHLKIADILISFPNFKYEKQKVEVGSTDILWKTFPQSKEDYEKGFSHIIKNLKEGNSYLTNYTCQTEVKTDLSLKQIYALSEAKYKVYFNDRFTFFSPETFIKIIGNKIEAFPMKGTIDASIENAQEILKQDEKELAEHYTIVDLLRNDLSIVADNVRLEEFQKIDFIKTQNKNLYAMSSKISGEIKLKFENRVGSILKSILPAGSILGAPKPKTLEIILEAESYARGFYTGICGWFDGENMDTCVMIRFIEKQGEKFYFKSGGGITHQSQIDSEYQEMKNKIYVPIR